MNHLERSHPYRCGADLRFGITEAQFRSDAIHDVSPRVCKRCLASLAKRDRAFRRKSRRQFRPTPRHSAAWHRNRAWQATAREEGRFFSVYSAEGRARLGGDVLISRAREYAAEIGGYVVGPDGVREDAARAIAREEGR